jgi:ABC-type dipeptide/oligopeptide/nickel transport system permease subunit
MSSQPAAKRLTGTAWILALLPLLLLGIVLAYLVVSGGGLRELARPLSK